MAEAHKIAEDHQVAGQGEEGVAFDAVKQRDPRHRDLCSIARAEVVDVPCIFFRPFGKNRGLGRVGNYHLPSFDIMCLLLKG